MVQFKHDKSALFFSYVFPILLLAGIGYPMQLRGKPTIELAYADLAQSEASAAVVRGLQEKSLVKLRPVAVEEGPATQALERNDLRHYLELRAEPGGGLSAELFSNSLAENQIENAAIQSIVQAALAANQAPAVRMREVPSTRYVSYVVTLLPGIIGMTLLIIGLNGFGATLIQESQAGLLKNLKTIDASPVPFLSGLLLSRLVVCYSVAAAMVVLGRVLFATPADVNYLMLFAVVTLGCLTFLGMGLVLATLSPSVQAFNGIVNFVQMPLVIMGGVFFSVSGFPKWLQMVNLLNPLAQFTSAMRGLLFESVGFHDLSRLAVELGGLSAWGVSMLVLARLRFKW
jgi:ABC-type polysaccharide/polyol phosphate export permease